MSLKIIWGRKINKNNQPVKIILQLTNCLFSERRKKTTKFKINLKILPIPLNESKFMDSTTILAQKLMKIQIILKN